MAPFLFFLLQSSLILNTTIVTGSYIFNSFYYFEDNENVEVATQTKLPPIIATSSLDLNSLSLDSDGDKKFNRKRRMINDSPVSPFGYSSRNNSPNTIMINEYTEPSQVLKAEDDYFFLDLDNSESKLEKYRPTTNHSYQSNYPKSVEVKAKPASKLNEELVLVGSEFVPKDQAKLFKRKKEEVSEEEATRPRVDSGLYETIMTNLYIAIRTLSPKSVRKMFEPEIESSDDSEEEESVNPVAKVNAVPAGEHVIKKESSDDFSDMIKRYYKDSYLDLEKAEHLAI